MKNALEMVSSVSEPTMYYSRMRSKWDCSQDIHFFYFKRKFFWPSTETFLVFS